MEQVIAFVLDMASQNPKVAAILMIIGGFRLIFKPLMAGIESYVSSSDSKKDDLILLSVKENFIFKAISFIIDYAFSIKVKKNP